MPIMRTGRFLSIVIFSLSFLSSSGCIRRAGLPETPTPRAAPPVDRVETHLLGAWRPTERGAAGSQMVFEKGGVVEFQGGLAYLNPANWSLSRDRQELVLTFPQAPNARLDIFRMQVGDGVKAFDRSQKSVTYHMDEGTNSLNIAGWMYSKVSEPLVAPSPEAEPVLK